MSLNKAEKERVTDSKLKLQSVSHSLKHIDPAKIPGYEDIEKCLEDAEKSLSGALRSPGSSSQKN
jgi:hypothetical protein